MTKNPKYITKPCPYCSHTMKVVNGLWLRDIREATNLTQREFGKPLNLSSPYISDIETNRRDCPDYIFQAYMALKD